MQLIVTTPVQAPADVVWPIIRDVTRWHEWTASITAIELLTPGAFAPGTRARVRQPKLPPAVWEVTKVEEGHGFEWAYRGPWNRTTGLHYVEPRAGGGSLVTLGLRYEGWVAKVIGRLTRELSLRYVNLEAAGLRERAEALVALHDAPR